MSKTRKPQDRSRIDAAREHMLVFRGPMAKVYSCPFCPFFHKLPKVGFQRIVGPHAWLAHSAAASSRVAAHILREHPDKLALPAGGTAP